MIWFGIYKYIYWFGLVYINIYIQLDEPDMQDTAGEVGTNS